jgi:hypothetical protein
MHTYTHPHTHTRTHTHTHTHTQVDQRVALLEDWTHEAREVEKWTLMDAAYPVAREIEEAFAAPKTYRSFFTQHVLVIPYSTTQYRAHVHRTLLQYAHRTLLQHSTGVCT